MEATFDPTERRIVGVLIEKELTTPDLYPLTLNALVAGCNQRSNRHPVTDLKDFEVEGALRALFVREWVTNTNVGGRTIRWRHRVDDKLGVDREEKAVLAELLLRGPQQPGELRARVGRMAEVPTQEALAAILGRLEQHLPPLVRVAGRAPGERAVRYAQTLAPDDELPVTPVAVPATTSPPAAPPPSPPEVLARLAALEDEVARLRAAVEALRGGREAGA